MKVVTIIGGLGSQMFKYSFFLKLRDEVEDKCYISTLPYFLADMWNGYELNKIFGIQELDFINFFNEDEIKNLAVSNQNYVNLTFKKLYEVTQNRLNYRVNRGKIRKYDKFREKSLQEKTYNKIIYFINPHKCKSNHEESVVTHIDEYEADYNKLAGNVMYDEFNHTSDKYLPDKELLKNIFRFPDFDTAENILISRKMMDTNSVAIHVRRSDHMYDNEELFRSNYFMKAVNFIKDSVVNPYFYIFSEEADWCINNLHEIGINLEEDHFKVIDWNKNENSFRDMQLMTFCKHNILAISSFCWWGYYLSVHSEKKVCAPNGYWLEVDVHF